MLTLRLQEVCAVACLIALTGFVAAHGSDTGSPKGSDDGAQGIDVVDDVEVLSNNSWEPVSFYKSGAQLDVDRFGGTLRFSEEQYQLELHGGTRLYKYRLYADRHPKVFEVWDCGTLEEKREARAEPDFHGIYEIDDDVLRRCYVKYGEPLPTGFTISSTAVDRSTATVHKRVHE